MYKVGYEDDQPLGKIRIRPFRDLKESYHYIYRGINVIGSDPRYADICLKSEEIKLLNVRLKIKAHGNGVLEARDPSNQGFGIVSTTLEVKGMEPEEMDPEDYSKFEIKSKIRIGGVIVVERVELNKEELGADTRRCIARADFINQDIPKMDTRVRPQVVFTAWETRSSQRPRVSKTTENSHQQPSNLRPVSTDPLHGDSIDSTWTMEKLTKSMNNSDLPWPRAPGRINRTARTPIYQIVGNILPQELLSRRNPMPQGSNDEETIDHGISDQETSDQETSDQEISDQEIRDQETRDQEIRDQETGYHESSDRETSDHDAESQSPRSTQMTKSD